MTTATSEAAAFRARIQHQRRAARLPMARPFLTTPEAQAKQATLALLAGRANAARDRYEATAYATAYAQQRTHLAHLFRF